MKLKKIVSIVLGLALMLSLGTVAFADGVNESGETPTYEDMDKVIVSKTYVLTNAGTISPAETFTFSTLTCTGVKNAGVGVTKGNAPVPNIESVSYTVGEAGSNTATKEIIITLPGYDAVGIYTYTFTETDNGTAGVTYRSDAITLVVTVIEQNGKVRVAAVHTEGENEQKNAAFDNVYSAGSLAVKKTVDGIMGDHEKVFHATVTFIAPDDDTVKSTITYVDDGENKTIELSDWTNGVATAEITLKHNETVTFGNLPYGVTYTVAEREADEDGYTTSYIYDDQDKKIDSASENVEITNTKGGMVDTGIYMDSMPYILLLAVVAVAAIVFFSKKRYAKD